MNFGKTKSRFANNTVIFEWTNRLFDLRDDANFNGMPLLLPYMSVMELIGSRLVNGIDLDYGDPNQISVIFVLSRAFLVSVH